MEGPTPLPVLIKWAGKEIQLPDISGERTVKDLKSLIEARTGVRPQRQKLLNLSFKGKVAGDDCILAQIGIKPNHKIMMMGSLEKDIEEVDVPPEERPEVENDLDLPAEDLETTEVFNLAVNKAKVARRVAEYEVEVLNPFREGKKLLVLDIDYTLFDHRSVAETGIELMRPYLHDFLTAAYEHYDIAIWSATSMKWIKEKMRLLGVDINPNYKIVFYLDYLAMITVHTQKYGVINVKPLAVIWGKYACYTPQNTIMFDDLRRNFMMNPHNGLRIRPFRSAHVNRDKDDELLRLAAYLKLIAPLEDISSLNHNKWEHYLEKGSRSRSRRKDASSSNSSNSNEKV